MENLVLAERQRRIADVDFQASSVLTAKIEPDSVHKFFVIRLVGAVTTTFGSGTPVASAFSCADDVIPRIDLTVNGSRTVKSQRPYFLHMQQLLWTKIRGQRLSSAAAAAATGNLPTADAGFTYGATTEVTTVSETVIMAFENVYAPEVQRPLTWLNLKGESSCELKFTTAAFSALLGFGNTAPVTYSADTFNIEIATIEAQHVPENAATSDWKQTTKAVQYSAEQTEALIEINRGNSLQALMLLGRTGAAGSATTATGKLANNLVLRKLKMLLNGQSVIKDTSFQLLQAEMRARYGISAAFASNVSIIDGFARMDFCHNGDLNTVLRLKQPDVNSAHLAVNTSNTTDVSYTNPIEITVQTEELVLPQ